MCVKLCVCVCARVRKWGLQFDVHLPSLSVTSTPNKTPPWNVTLRWHPQCVPVCVSVWVSFFFSLADFSLSRTTIQRNVLAPRMKHLTIGFFGAITLTGSKVQILSCFFNTPKIPCYPLWMQTTFSFSMLFRRWKANWWEESQMSNFQGGERVVREEWRGEWLASSFFFFFSPNEDHSGSPASTNCVYGHQMVTVNRSPVVTLIRGWRPRRWMHSNAPYTSWTGEAVPLFPCN